MQNQDDPQNVTVSLEEIRNIYPHLPSNLAQKSKARHVAILCFVHDPENAANALGQSFLARHHDDKTKHAQPHSVVAEMSGADFKIFDLTPPERQARPCTEHDLGMAISYGMVTVEQGMDTLALETIGQDTQTLLQNIHNFDDIIKHGAINIGACYGALLAAIMADVPVILPSKLANCLERVFQSETEQSITLLTSDQDFSAHILSTVANWRMQA